MALTPRPPEWTDTAPVKVSASREIVASADDIFTALADHEAWAEWFPKVTQVERYGDLTEGVGSTRRVHIGKVEVDEEFILWEPGKVWGFTAVEIRGAPNTLDSLNERVSIQQLSPDRCRVTYLMAFGPRPRFTWLFARVLRKPLTKNLRAALAGLERRLTQPRT